MESPFRQVSDTELVNACLAGASLAWDELVHRYSNLVYAIIWKYQHQWNLNAEVVQDIYQKVWLKVLQPEKLRQLKETNKLQVWIGVITTGECIDFMRSMKRRQTIQPEPPIEYDDIRLKAVMRVALRRLSHEACQKLIMAVYYQGLTHKEAADELDIPLGSISKMLRDNLKELHEDLNRMGYFEE